MFRCFRVMLLLIPLVFVSFVEGKAAGNNPGESNEDLAKQLQNPVADLISVPLQNNWDFGIGSAGAMRYSVNIQPVIPFSIGEQWNLITRTIVPVIYAASPVAGGLDRAGLGDILQSFFFSPKAPTARGWIWGVGPVMLYPSATEKQLGSGQFAMGPTVVLLNQKSGWTYGALLNHLWSVTGDGGRPDVNASFLQPFLSYTTKSHTTFGLNTESTYDWKKEKWTVPINLTVQQLLKFGNQPLAFQIGGRYYADRPSGGPDWGIRFSITLLFPK